MRNWEMLYDRQPLQLDAILLALALALHMPLLLIHMKAPQKGAKGQLSRLHNIDLHLQNPMVKPKPKPVVLPPKLPSKTADIQKAAAERAAKMAKLLKPDVLKPPPPKPRVEPDLKMPDTSKIQTDSLK